MKIGVADYGMNVWYGGLYNLEQRLKDLKNIGFDGIERLEAASADDAMARALTFRKLGMAFSTCRGPNVQVSAEWTAALGKDYIWLTCGDVSREVDFAVYCRRANAMCAAVRPLGIEVAIHNHMHQRVQFQQELEDFLGNVPDAKIVFDAGHMMMADGDPVDVIRKYHDRIIAVHLKDVFKTGGKRPDGIDNYRFCELGAGNFGVSNQEVIQALKASGYNRWIHIEHDQHQRDPLVDLAVSYHFIKDAWEK